jgi:hypothetical protein
MMVSFALYLFACAVIATIILLAHTAILGEVDLSSYFAGVVALLICDLVRAD